MSPSPAPSPSRRPWECQTRFTLRGGRLMAYLGPLINHAARATSCVEALTAAESYSGGKNTLKCAGQSADAQTHLEPPLPLSGCQALRETPGCSQTEIFWAGESQVEEWVADIRTVPPPGNPAMSRSRQPPLVTGISPNEGTPWTKVTIRGENLGTGPADLIGLSICGHNCLLTAEWMSASKIVCRVGPAKDDKGEIIVTTKSGGDGTSTVSFKLLKTEKIGQGINLPCHRWRVPAAARCVKACILDQSAVWVDEMNYYDMRTDRNKGISPLSLRPANPLGIDIDKTGSLKISQYKLRCSSHASDPQERYSVPFSSQSDQTALNERGAEIPP
ncbi:hypothetical protein JZ751_004124, partial [Albula glossodonta]